MISDKMISSLNRQINREIYSGYLYLGMASYAADQGLMGIANWFKVQKEEEFFHAGKIYDYVEQQGGRVILEAIEKPPQEFTSIVQLFIETLDHEKNVTSMINDLVTLAQEEKDRATEIFLQWFVTEQVEEEANASDLLQKFKIIGDNGQGLLMLDSELAKRVFNATAEEE